MTAPTSKQGGSARPERKENLLINLLCNVAVPALILTKLSAPGRLGPVWSLVIALAFPVVYSLYDFIVFRTWSLFSVVGFVSTLLTGGLGLLDVPAFWIAVKEAAVPAFFGVAVVGSLRTEMPLIRTLLYNEKVIDTARVALALQHRGTVEAFERLLTKSTFLLAGSFFMSAGTNFALAQFVLKSAPGTPEFKVEMGRMLALSWPVNVLPGMVAMVLLLWYLLAGIKRLSGLGLDEVFRDPEKSKVATATVSDGK